MKIKNIIKLSAAAAITFATASCNFLDVLPDSRTIIDSEEKITKLLVTAYPEAQPLVLFEFMSDNVDDNGPSFSAPYETAYSSYHYTDVSSTSTDSPYALWSSYYKAIATANTALKAIEDMGDPETLSAQKAEALMCRAFSHLWLTHIFCQAYNAETSGSDLGIPYITEPETSVNHKYERGTVAQVYAKINEDIENALPYIDDAIYIQPKAHFNKRAAYGFAAEFNLYYGNYDKAVRYATEALGGNPQLRDYYGLSLKNLSDRDNLMYEYISDQNRANLLIVTTLSSFGNQLPNTYRYMHTRQISETETYRSTGPWVNGRTSHSEKDYTFLEGLRSFGATEYLAYTPKNTTITEIADPVAGTRYSHVVWVPITTDKVALIRAEANVMLGNLDLAGHDLRLWYSACDMKENTIATDKIIEWYKEKIESSDRVVSVINPRWGEFTMDVDSDQYAMLIAVLHARRIEGVHEGLRWIDVKRMGIRVYHNVVYGTSQLLEPFDKRAAIQIPEAVSAAGVEKNPR